jgi:hypothetical protein
MQSTRIRRWTRLRAAIGLVAVLVLPGATRLFGSGEAAWSMFAERRLYKLRFLADQPDGRRVEVAPAEIGRALGGGSAQLFYGADHLRSSPRVTELARRLPDLARVACELRPGAVRVEAILEEREREDGPAKTTRARAECR